MLWELSMPFAFKNAIYILQCIASFGRKKKKEMNRFLRIIHALDGLVLSAYLCIHYSCRYSQPDFWYCSFSLLSKVVQVHHQVSSLISFHSLYYYFSLIFLLIVFYFQCHLLFQILFVLFFLWFHFQVFVLSACDYFPIHCMIWLLL